MALGAGLPTRTKTTPVDVPRTQRRLEHRVLTSFQPGIACPVMAYPLLREDAAQRVDLRLTLTQKETVELLVNAVNFRALAYLVPFSAFNRFNGMDQFNRSYMKQPEIDGGAVQSWVTTQTFLKASTPILTKMGFHAAENAQVNAAYSEAYNEIFNMRARNRSPDLVPRASSDQTLAPAFWNHQLWANVVPDFDQASIEGEVPLSFTSSKAPVSGIGIANGSAQIALANRSVRETGKTPVQNYPMGFFDPQAANTAAGHMQLVVKDDPAHTGWPAIYAELAASGATISLANIELARRTQAFALLRRQYNGLEDDYIMDLLMSGITVPDQELRAPILLADRSTVVGMAKRYASGSADELLASVTNGGTFLDLRFRTPQIHTGGIIMVIVEVVPEQLFERQRDPWLSMVDQATLPEFIRDTLDPEKVDIVQNSEVDVFHSTPASTFGYTYLNQKWARSAARVGGKFYRPNPDGGFDEDRQRIWAVETLNPTLSRDFYLCGTVNRKPFVDEVSDAYEVVVRGASLITGNTVFGRPLIEASDDYDEILDYLPPDGGVIPKAAGVSGPESAQSAGVVAPAEAHQGDSPSSAEPKKGGAK